MKNVIRLVFFGLFLVGCGADGTPESTPGTPTGNTEFSEVTVYSNPSSPLQLGFKSKGGTFIQLAGSKSEQGTPLNITDIFLTSEDGKASQVILDENGRPLDIFLSDGSRIKLIWDIAGNAAVTMIATDGSESTSQLDMSTIVPQKSTATNRVKASPTDFNIKPQFLASPIASPIVTLAPTIAAQSGVVRVSVTSNGEPVSGGNIFASASSSPLTPSQRVVLREKGKGIYEGSFVNLPATVPAQQLTNDCRGTLGDAAKICKGLAPVAAQLVPLCILLGVTPGGLLSVGICESVLLDLAAICTILAAPGASDLICITSGVVVDFFDPNGVTISASITKDSLHASAQKFADSGTSLVELALELPSRSGNYSGTFDTTKIRTIPLPDDGGICSFEYFAKGIVKSNLTVLESTETLRGSMQISGSLGISVLSGPPGQCEAGDILPLNETDQISGSIRGFSASFTDLHFSGSLRGVSLQGTVVYTDPGGEGVPSFTFPIPIGMFRG